MRVAVDATMIKSDQGGLRTVALGLCRALADIGGMHVDVLTLAEDRSDWGSARQIATTLRSGNPQVRLAWREANLPKLLRRLRADALIVANPEPLITSPVPQLVLFHDLGPLLAPAYYGRARFLRYLATVRATCRRSSRVLSVSVSTRNDLVRWADLDPRKVDVIGLAPQPLRALAGEDATRSWPAAPYVLYVGAALRHKNLVTLLRAFDAPVLSGVRLIMCGPDYAGEVDTLLRGSPSTRPVEHRGFVSAAELSGLYGRASAFALPSLFEGFGLPVLEAFQHGLPVVASDIPALRETGAGHATYVADPLDDREWARVLAGAAAAPSTLETRATLCAHAAGFTWQTVAGRVEHSVKVALEQT